MANARKLHEPAKQVNQNVAGPPTIVLELDDNEAEAVRWFILHNKRSRGEVAAERARAESGLLASGSLAAAGIRVGDALSNI